MGIVVTHDGNPYENQPNIRTCSIKQRDWVQIPCETKNLIHTNLTLSNFESETFR